MQTHVGGWFYSFGGSIHARQGWRDPLLLPPQEKFSGSSRD